MRGVRPSSSRAGTPRPSISPLSTANRSPEATRDTVLNNDAMQAEADNGIHGDLQDDSSSILSDPDDERDDFVSANAAIGNRTPQPQLVAQSTKEDDSEAETERLENTPQKLFQHADSTGRTPSKLSQAATVEEELSEPPSPLQMNTGAASSTSTVGPIGKKRKRSETAESPLTSAESDLEESPRKRSHEMHPEPAAEEGDDTIVPDDTLDGVAKAEVEVVAPQEELGTPAPVALTKGMKGKKGKPKGRKMKETHPEIEIEQPEEIADAPEAEPSADVAKGEGERLAKAAASSAFEGIAKQFTAFREKLYDERLATMNTEISMLAQPDCQHPEYLRQVACVNARREKQMREAQAYYHYRLTSIRQRTLGDRSQLQSQYHQHIREMREDVMYKLGEDWYNIQKERRQQHQEMGDAYIYKFPAKKSAQIRQQAKYNQEISVLSGVAKYVGFPAAPDINGADGDGLEDDLKAMKISKRVPQPATAPAPALPSAQPAYQRYPTVPTQNEALAHQQYIEQNAWAQPQRPLHNLATPGLTHTPDWVDRPGNHSSARNLIRNLSGQNHLQRTGSPYATPLPQKRQGPPEQLSSSGTVAINSDGVDPPSSVLAAPPTNDRNLIMHHYASTPQPSPLHVGKQRIVNGGGVVMDRDLTGFRNVSNISAISGTSTIDAPQAPESAERRRDYTADSLPALISEANPQQHGFTPSQHHREDVQGKEAYAGVGFRPGEGAFSTPAPLPASNIAP
ncbi:hypothetical protein LTR17_011048 [Elasticomyces elasticus]|nr:hypothetical protein LTR17_011048 [Elasticomyces elasticus]